ncbi:type II secretion system F family protein [Paenibacillus thermotolerans]|uniref:type II secretion system F family protein n=1 Tax=Paenibacillus thermotolerans TaxID=3027807 RepID=UPI002367F5F7|nr:MULTISPECIES: type II secretion system F family protein [unclassified Paenibacillus]
MSCGTGAAIGFTIGMLFYDSVLFSLALSVIGGFLVSRDGTRHVTSRKKLLAAQFEHALQSISSNLFAGKSMENAIASAALDLRLMYAGQSPYLVVELERIKRMLEHGIPIEQALDDFGRRLQIADIADWIDVFRTAKRSGGDLLAVMRHTSRAIGEKMDLERELAVMVAGKRFESNVLAVVPLLLLAGLKLGSPDYMAPLYEGAGRFIMTGALLTLLFSFYLTRRFMRFEL